MNQAPSKIVNIPRNKHGFEPATYAKLINDNCTALPGNSDVKSIRKTRFQNSSLNDYLSNFLQKLKTKKLNL